MLKQVRVVLDEETYRKLIAIKGWCTTLDGHEQTMGGAVTSAVQGWWLELRRDDQVPSIEGLPE